MLIKLHAFLGLARLCSAMYYINTFVPCGLYTHIPVNTKIGAVCFHCGNDTSLDVPDRVYWNCKLFIALLRAIWPMVVVRPLHLQ